MSKTKACHKCGQVRLLDAFYKGSGKYKHDTYCKECRKQINTEYYAAHKKASA